MNRTVAMDNSSTQEGLDMMEIYRAVIAAKNNVSEAMNGPSVTINNGIKICGLLVCNAVFYIYRWYIFCRNLFISTWIRFV